MSKNKLIINIVFLLVVILYIPNILQSFKEPLHSYVISDLNIKDISELGGNHIIQIEYPMESDPREDIFKYAIKSKWSIIEMSPYKKNLEDVFRSLTGMETENA